MDLVDPPPHSRIPGTAVGKICSEGPTDTAKMSVSSGMASLVYPEADFMAPLQRKNLRGLKAPLFTSLTHSCLSLKLSSRIQCVAHPPVPSLSPIGWPAHLLGSPTAPGCPPAEPGPGRGSFLVKALSLPLSWEGLGST